MYKLLVYLGNLNNDTKDGLIEILSENKKLVSILNKRTLTYTDYV